MTEEARLLVEISGVPRIIVGVTRETGSNRISSLLYERTYKRKGKDSVTYTYSIAYLPKHQLVQMCQNEYEYLFELRRNIKDVKKVYRDYVRQYIDREWAERYGEFEQ